MSFFYYQEHPLLNSCDILIVTLLQLMHLVFKFFFCFFFYFFKKLLLNSHSHVDNLNYTIVQTNVWGFSYCSRIHFKKIIWSFLLKINVAYELEPFCPSHRLFRVGTIFITFPPHLILSCYLLPDVDGVHCFIFSPFYQCASHFEITALYCWIESAH